MEKFIQPVVRSFASLTYGASKGASKMLRATGHARMVNRRVNVKKSSPRLAWYVSLNHLLTLAASAMLPSLRARQHGGGHALVKPA